MDNFPMQDILDKLYREYESIRPDLVIMLGDRIFNFLMFLREHHEQASQITAKAVDLNALSFIDCSAMKILVVDDETEYARKISHDLYSVLKYHEPKSVSIFTVFLSDEPDAKTKRSQNRHSLLLQKDAASECISSAMRTIHRFQAYKNPREFHDAMFEFSCFVRSKLTRPSNADATVFHVTLASEIPKLDHLLSQLGEVIRYSRRSTTLIPSFFDAAKLINFGAIQPAGKGLARIRVFQIDDHVLNTSPMVYLPLRFENVTETAHLLDSQASLHALLKPMLGAFLENYKHPSDDRRYALALYDLLGFWLDAELFACFLHFLRKRGVSSDAVIDEATCVSHYGVKLGGRLHSVVQTYIASAEMTPEPVFTFERNRPDPSQATFAPEDLFLTKALCLAEYRSATKDGVMATIPWTGRNGLNYVQLLEKTGFPALTVNTCLDILSDTMMLKAFNQVTSSEANSFIIDRIFNTETPDFIGVFVRLLQRAENSGVKIGKFNLQKFLVLLWYFVLFKNRNQLRKKEGLEPKVIYRQEGKMLVLDIRGDDYDELNGPITLDRLLLQENSDIFAYDTVEKAYNVQRNPQTGVKTKHNNVTRLDTLDGFLDKFISVYRMLETFVASDPELKGLKQHTYDLFAGFVDLVGEKFPQAGLYTVSRLINKALTAYEAEYVRGRRDLKFPKLKSLLFDSAPHKLRVLRDRSHIFLALYKFLSQPYPDVFLTEIWTRMAVFPEDSLIVDLYERVTKHLMASLDSNPKSCVELGQSVKSLLDLAAIACGNAEVHHERLGRQKTSQDCYIVSVDLLNSTKLGDLSDERWRALRPFLMRIAMAWENALNARFIDAPGDELIVAFSDLRDALGFAAGAAVHINEISASVNEIKVFPYIVGCHTKMTYGNARMDDNAIVDSAALNRMMKDLPKLNMNIAIADRCMRVPESYILENAIVERKTNYLAVDPRILFQKLIPNRYITTM